MQIFTVDRKRIAVESRAAQRAGRTPVPVATNRVIPIDLPPLHILVVEDLEDAAQSTAELLTMCGHRVRITHSGADALRAVDEAMPDVVLLDIGLPGISGWEVARHIRDTASAKQPLIVAVTGYGTEADRWRSADSGIDLHLVKPADPGALTAFLARVREHLAAKR